MNRAQLISEIKRKKSVLCVGLDTDLTKIPKHLLVHEDPAFEFNKAIIDATKEYTVAYKINTAFYEAQGLKGWVSLQKTLEYIPNDIFTIADAKRGDIGLDAEVLHALTRLLARLDAGDRRDLFRIVEKLTQSLEET